mmetsp:Transcript_41498/g.88419  ORF Transcript_41498/g.88419 Transcript_41498/m.88419 type:complete len:81 (-) Transcript_41498:249-491(-)
MRWSRSKAAAVDQGSSDIAIERLCGEDGNWPIGDASEVARTTAPFGVPSDDCVAIECAAVALAGASSKVTPSAHAGLGGT